MRTLLLALLLTTYAPYSMAGKAHKKAAKDAFTVAKGHLPWPVQQGTILYHYGSNRLDDRLTFFNPGITISAEPGVAVCAVFDGEVTSVTEVDGKIILILRHGSYFTSYGNLSSVVVSKGDKVKKGTVIGQVADDTDADPGQLDFILLKNQKGLNPEIWLSKRPRQKPGSKETSSSQF